MAFLFTNCEPDINTDIKAKESSRFSTQDLNTEQIRSKKHITEKLEDLNLENAASHDSQNKIVYNGSYGFTVNTDLVKYVEDLETGNHSYSFSIQRDSTITNNLENLLLQYNPADGNYYAYIVQYAFTNDELQDLNETYLNSTNTIIFPIDYDISTLELGKMTWGCVSNGHWVNNTDHNGELHGANCTCDSESTWVVTEVTCGYYDDGSGSGDGSTNSPWIPNTGNEPGGGYGDPNNPNNNGSGPTEIFAAPTPTQTQAELLATYLDLNPQQEIWANKSQNENQVRAINNYLFANCGADTNSSGCQEAQAFVIAALEALMENSVISTFPFVKYPNDLSSQYKQQYPKLTAYLSMEFPKLSKDNLIINALNQYGSLNNEQIKNALKWGNDSSVTIMIIDMPCCWGAYGPQFGYDENTILLSTELAAELESNSTISEDALNFFIGIVILHEVTHLGDYLYNGDMYDGEEGNDFELDVIGDYMLNPNNSSEYFQGYK
ncbi:hypothetical protein [Bizionia sp. M204]|uniref:hypothetical protein n=1 Tax=Bizionia sp. M204 TaxID=2675331 RepID=UPI002063583B|nr:hypothetical protein [Bizionia sp. M204]UPS92511.1 hypothetical protein GMA17_12590 [Bizionia sp. M204]